ncbi:extracellular solute-binding protein [Cohnella sp.]|uniref:extracellular solute-binding protein n=1 Tax=Cohnella sp. TaxID=1883426 RepID=UPI00356A5688
MSMKKKGMGLLAAMLASTALLSACGGNENKTSEGTGTPEPSSTAQASASAQSEQPATEISILSIFYQKEPPAAGNEILKEVEKRTNTKLNITWVTPNNFNEKVNVTLASGKLPDLTLVTDTANAAFRSMAKQGAFWDLTELIKDYPNLMKFPDVTFTNNLIEGRLYGVPRVRPTEGNAQPLIRTDWLEKLGLSMPRTMDELYAVMKAFKDNAPDGKENTVGLSGYVNQDNMGQLGFIEDAFNGTAGKYKVVDGKLADVTFEPSERQALEWLRNAYADKLIPQDFALLKHDQAKDLIFSGKAGIFPDKPNQIPGMLQELKKSGQAQADLEWVSYLEGPNGKFASKGNGHFGMFVIPRNVPEDKVKKLLAFLDYGASDEGHELASYGRPGVEHNLKDNSYELTEKAKNDPSFQFMQNIFMKFDKYANLGTGLPADKLAKERKLIDEAAEVSVTSPTNGLISETATTSGSDYSKKIQDMKTKVIMGDKKLEDWDKFVEQLKADKTYLKILEEFDAAYQARANAK